MGSEKNAGQPITSCPASGVQASQRDRHQRKVLTIAVARPIVTLDRVQFGGGEVYHWVIRARHTLGLSQAELARQFGASYQRVYQIVHGKRK